MTPDDPHDPPLPPLPEPPEDGLTPTNKLVLITDIVMGTANGAPYLGQIVDPADLLAPQTEPMVEASLENAPEAPSPGCIVTVRGLSVAHAGVWAICPQPLPPVVPLTTCPSVTLNGQPLLVDHGSFFALPPGGVPTPPEDPQPPQEQELEPELDSDAKPSDDDANALLASDSPGDGAALQPDDPDAMTASEERSTMENEVGAELDPLDPSAAVPTETLHSLELLQNSVFIHKAVEERPPEEVEAAAAQAAVDYESSPVRTDYTEPTPELVLASQIPPDLLPDLIPAELLHLVGDPVDVATGAVISTATDWHSEKYDLAFVRTYTSRKRHRRGSLGWGWSHCFEQRLERGTGHVLLREGGRTIPFIVPTERALRIGDIFVDPTGGRTLTWMGDAGWRLRDASSMRTFRRAHRSHGQSLVDRWRLSILTRPGLPPIEFVYDRGDRLRELRCGVTTILTLGYDARGRLASLNHGLARYAHTKEHDLAAAFDPDRAARRYAYDRHLLVQETNRRGGSFYYGYEHQRGRTRCVRTWGDDGRLHRALDYQPGRTVVLDSLGDATHYELSALGMVTAIAEPSGRRTEFEYDFDKGVRLCKVTRGLRTRTHVRIPDANRTEHDDGDGATWTSIHDDRGNLVSGTDPQGGGRAVPKGRRGIRHGVVGRGSGLLRER